MCVWFCFVFLPTKKKILHFLSCPHSKCNAITLSFVHSAATVASAKNNSIVALLAGVESAPAHTPAHTHCTVAYMRRLHCVFFRDASYNHSVYQDKATSASPLVYVLIPSFYCQNMFTTKKRNVCLFKEMYLATACSIRLCIIRSVTVFRSLQTRQHQSAFKRT